MAREPARRRPKGESGTQRTAAMRRLASHFGRLLESPLAALGLVMYTVTQGAQFLALDRLPAQTTSLVLSFRH